MVDTALLPASTFYVGEDAIKRVTKFRYLGRILSQDDNDLSACVRNIQRAKAKWAAVSKVLKREGASKKSFARFYLVIVSTVLLYGSDTCVVTRRMEEQPNLHLSQIYSNSFITDKVHHRVAILTTPMRKKNSDGKLHSTRLKPRRVVSS
jgi:hypothetical protein